MLPSTPGSLGEPWAELKHEQRSKSHASSKPNWSCEPWAEPTHMQTNGFFLREQRSNASMSNDIQVLCHLVFIIAHHCAYRCVGGIWGGVAHPTHILMIQDAFYQCSGFAKSIARSPPPHILSLKQRCSGRPIISHTSYP